MVSHTGERLGVGDEDFLPDVTRHLAAYHACLPLIAGKVALDGGCGEGYGANWLAGSARLVLGVDRSREALREGLARRRGNVSFVCSELTRLSFADAAFDVMCSLQVLEHFRNPQPFLREAVRILRPTGVLVLSTPNRLTSFSENPYHFKEYRPAELHGLLTPWFSSVELLGLFGNETVMERERARRREVEGILRLDPLGLRRILPDSTRKWAFARLARVVRARVRANHGEASRRVRLEDFTVRSGRVEESLDLFAVCRK